jgi:hypothetical protein
LRCSEMAQFQCLTSVYDWLPTCWPAPPLPLLLFTHTLPIVLANKLQRCFHIDWLQRFPGGVRCF